MLPPVIYVIYVQMIQFLRDVFHIYFQKLNPHWKLWETVATDSNIKYYSS